MLELLHITPIPTLRIPVHITVFIVSGHPAVKKKSLF